MSAIKPRDEMTRTELVSYILRSCALLVDPRLGLLRSLAETLEVHEVTVSAWIAQGYVPQHQALKLNKRFGEHAPVDDLCPAEFRRN